MKSSMKCMVLTLSLLYLATTAAQAGLRGYWTFDDTTADATGSGLDGVLNGDAGYSTEVPAAIGSGKSLDLDGDGDYVLVDVTTGRMAGTFTLSAWVRLADTSKSAIFSTRRPSDTSFDCKFDAGNLIHGDIGSGGGWIDTSADAAFNYSINTWYHLVYVVQPTGYAIYVDGVLLNAEGFSGIPLLWDSSHDIWIGKYGGGATEDFGGQIDDIAVWDTALSAAQIQQVYAGVSPTSIAPRIDNGSFEANTFGTYPGYADANGGSIVAWTSDNYTRVGINPSSGSPFANNGTIPDGVNVGFIQNSSGTGYLQANLLNLTPGDAYRLSYRYNARGGEVPQIRVTLDTAVPTLLPSDAQFPSVGGANPYYLAAYEFTAEASSHTVTFENNLGVGDTTLTLDDVRIEAAGSAGWTTALWLDDGSSGVDGTAHYTHAVNLGDAIAAVINGVTFKAAGSTANPNEGIDGANYTTILPSVFGNDDGNNLTTGGSTTLANRFCYGPTPVDDTNNITMNGLIPGMAYETTVFGVSWDAPPGARILGYSVNGSAEVTFNENVHGNNNGIRMSYRGTADAAGRINVTGRLINDNQSFHTYGFCNKAEPSNDQILADAFAGSNGADHGAVITTRAPDHANRAQATAYVETGQNGVFHVYAQNGEAQFGANAGAAIDIDTGAHIKPVVMTIQADLQVGTLAGAVGANARGLGLGFYRNGTYDVNQEVAIDFTGLVLAPDGSLYLYEDGAYSGVTVAHSGGFDANTFYTLRYDIDVAAGTISNISLEGSTADYGPLVAAATAFDDGRTALLGMTGSSTTGGTFGYIDNLIVTELTAATSVGGTVFILR